VIPIAARHTESGETNQVTLPLRIADLRYWDNTNLALKDTVTVP
jgi:hypothetical protein